jgi:pSer/pThr/pTyr-binding forkhead associated (FHA) protein
MDKCPYCSAEIRPGDNFCLNCGNRLVPSTASQQQAQPVFGDATIPASEDWVPPVPEATSSAHESEWRDDEKLMTIANTSMEPPASPVDTSAASSSTTPVAHDIQDKVEHLAHLILRAATGEVLQEYSLVKTQTSIGRAPTSDILLSKDKLTSRRHATIRYENGNYVLVDERSAVGTFVNGQQLEEMTPRTLQDGDHIGIGEHELVFQANNSASSGVDIESMPTITVSPSAVADITYRTREDELLTAAADDDFSTRSMNGGDSTSSSDVLPEREAGLKVIVNDQNGLLENARVNTIYLSSTYDDLKECRAAVYHALRRMRYDVIAMEDYVATDQRPLEKCLADLASCDLYIGIFAWQYGYVPAEGNPDQKSITELEYRKARELSKPCLLYFLDEKAPWSPMAMDAATGKGERGERIRKLRQDLQQEITISLFLSPEDLAKKVSVDVERLNLQLTSEHANREARLKALLADQTGFLRDRLESFVGRQTELTQIRQHIVEKRQTGGYLTITGPAGQGKSSIIAKLVEEYGPENVVYHFIPFNPGPDHQVPLLRNLMASLILKYDLSEFYVASESRPALRDYFPRVLADLVAKGVRETIFIDGLDKFIADQQIGLPDLSFLPNNPPTGIVFVLSTRPNDTLRSLELLKPYYEFKLPNLSRADFDQILQHRGVTLEETLTDILYQVMDGNAEYLDLTAKALSNTDRESSIQRPVLNSVVLGLVQAQYWEKAMAVAKVINDIVQRDYALNEIALSLAQVANIDRALTITEEINFSNVKASTVLSIAHTLILSRREEQAFAILDKSAELARTIDQIEDRTAILQSVADELITLERNEQAVSILKEALALDELISNADTRSKAIISIIALVNRLDSSYAEAILEAYHEDQDPRVRQAVSQILEQSAEISTDIRTAIVRIFNTKQESVGAGLLVGNSHILTCAHVISQALNISPYTPEKPIDQVYLDFPFIAPNQSLSTKVIFWQPQRDNQKDDLDDIAGLQLESNLPKGAQAAPLIISEGLQGHTFRAWGFPRNFNRGLWASGVLIGHVSSGLIQARSEGISEGYSGAAVWDNELNGVVGIVDSRVGGLVTLFIKPTNALIEVWPMLSQYAMPPCPYRGLSAFREQDAPYFFGQESFITQLFEAVRRQPLVAVIGPPGSGKSSIVFAGLIPRLRQEGIWLITSFRPGNNPFRSVAEMVMPLIEPRKSEIDRSIGINKLAQRLQQRELVLRDVMEVIVQKYSAVHLLLVADQFEELYTMCRDTEKYDIASWMNS